MLKGMCTVLERLLGLELTETAVTENFKSGKCGISTIILGLE